jgi:hypothetical protein
MLLRIAPDMFKDERFVLNKRQQPETAKKMFQKITGFNFPK